MCGNALSFIWRHRHEECPFLVGEDGVSWDVCCTAFLKLRVWFGGLQVTSCKSVAAIAARALWKSHRLLSEQASFCNPLPRVRKETISQSVLYCYYLCYNLCWVLHKHRIKQFTVGCSIRIVSQCSV